MSAKNVLRETIDEFGRTSGFSRKAGAWYRNQEDSIVVMELQKSQYGRQYYVNISLWLLPLGEAQFPKEHTCHIRTRLSRMAPDEKRLSELLDLENDITDVVRREELSALLESRLTPALGLTSTLAGLRSADGQRLLKVSLVTGPAQQLLKGATGPQQVS